MLGRKKRNHHFEKARAEDSEVEEFFKHEFFKNNLR